MDAPEQAPMPLPPGGGHDSGDMSASMVAIMQSQVEDMRKTLNMFKVLAVAPPDVDPNIVMSQASVPPHADILVFGPTGSGKSSLIRTFYMALHGTREVPAEFADRITVKDTMLNEGTLRYVSAIVKPAKLDHRGGIVSSAIMCHDTRGHIWMDEREQKQLDMMLLGHVKDDSLVQQRNYRYARLLWEFWRRDVDLFPQEILVRKNGIQTKPHALLFVFDGSKEEIPDGEEERRFYRDIISMVREKGYMHPQVVLTRIDQVEAELAKSAGAAGSGGEAMDPELRLRQVLDKKIEEVVMKLEVERTSVHFTENYHSGLADAAEGKNASVDFQALKILMQCCSNADHFVAQNLHAPPRQGSCSLQ